MGYESWVERDTLMALDADPDVIAVSSQPMWLHWINAAGQAQRHAPDFFARHADGTGVLIDVRPDRRARARHTTVRVRRCKAFQDSVNPDVVALVGSGWGSRG